MHHDTGSPTSHSVLGCYFTYVPSHSPHFSEETPSLSPSSAYTPDIFVDPLNPLLAFRSPPLEHYHLSSTTMDASKLLQLQTAAAHSRPDNRPLQHSTSMSSNSSNRSDSSSSSGSCSPSPPSFCCARCRRNSVGSSGMVKVGTNLYYCSHCASMTGYRPG